MNVVLNRLPDADKPMNVDQATAILTAGHAVLARPAAPIVRNRAPGDRRARSFSRRGGPDFRPANDRGTGFSGRHGATRYVNPRVANAFGLSATPVPPSVDTRMGSAFLMDGSMVRAGRRIAAPYADRLSVINARATDRKQRLVFAAERRRALQQVGSLAYRYNMNSMDLPANRPEEKADMSRMSMAVARHGRRADILRM